jgi:hypothetical protein
MFRVLLREGCPLMRAFFLRDAVGTCPTLAVGVSHLDDMAMDERAT